MQDIVDEGRRLLDEGGPAAVTLRGIARRVGVTAPALYTYFPGIAELFTELIVQSYNDLAARVASAVDDAAGASVEDRVAAGPVAYREWALEQRQQFNLIFFDRITGYAAPVDGPTVEAQTAVLRPIGAEYASARGFTVEQLEADGDLLDDFLGWWGSFHGIVALEVNRHLDWRDPEAIFLRHLRSSIGRIVTR